jgi:hypothetical protein
VLQDYDGTKQPQIVLGQPVAQSGAKDLPLGSRIPALTAWSLDGQQIEWRPGGNRNCLIVFCALGHPAGRLLLDQAAKWAKEHGAQLAAFSVDWSLEQARRESATIQLETPLLFCGAGGLPIAKSWSVIPPARAFLISANGTIVSNPMPGKLP